MPPKKVSEHILVVIGQLEKVLTMNEAERIKAICELNRLFKAIQSGAWIVAPLYPDTDHATALVEAYRKTLKPKDILDDDPGPFMLEI
jgi:hypothetical protein